MKLTSQKPAAMFDWQGQRAWFPSTRDAVRQVLSRASLLSTRQLAVIACVLGVLTALVHRPFTHMEVGDTAFYDYIAQSILRGQLPYRDTIDIKFPGSVYLSALAMGVGHIVGLRDVLAVRVLYVLLTGIFSAALFLVAVVYMRSRAAGAVAFLIPLALPHFGEWVTTGTEPKLPMMICGLAALLMVAWNRPLQAGIWGMAACLFWQPGLMFVGTAFLIFSRYLTSWRDWRALRVLAGAAMPLGLALLYFYHKGVLGDFWAWTMQYNYSVFGPEAERTLPEATLHIWKVSVRVFQAASPLIPLAVIGAALYTWERLKPKRRFWTSLASADLYRDALLWPPLVYFAFCLINFQAGPDLLPLLPFIGIFAAGFLAAAAVWLARSRWTANWTAAEKSAAVPASVCGVLLLSTMFSAATYHLPGWAMREQERILKPLADALGPDDKIYTHGSAELLVLFGRPNLTPYLFLDWGADEFAARRRGIPFSEIVAEMEAQAPKVVALARLKAVEHRDDFQRWVAEHYTQTPLPGYDGIYIRKPQPETPAPVAGSPR